MTVYTAAPSITRSAAGCQSAADDLMSDAASTCLNVSSAAVTLADFQSVLPFHSPVYSSGPSSPSSTVSSRCFCVHDGPIASAVLPLALIVAAWVKNSFHVLGGPAMPSVCSVLGTNQI